MDAPVLGVYDQLQGSEQKWEISWTWRYQHSFRHFVGTVEQPHRVSEDSNVINHINLTELGIRYNFTPRNSVTVTIPYLIATRSYAIRDQDRNVVGRTQVQAHGLSDVTIVGRRLLFDPAAAHRGNISVGLGIKLPTGADSTVDTRLRTDENGNLVPSLETNDQSIQPGDGGFGIIVDASGYRNLARWANLTAYGSGGYLINPSGTNGVYTYRGRPAEAIMSVADQYLARVGLLVAPASWKGLSLGLGGRWEGVPVHDLIGSSEGFRRPGYAVSIEPSLTWTHGNNTLSLAVPYAVRRDRQRSVPDLESGTHGDAAFADYLYLLGWWHRF